jgi:hypothetical protein
MSWGSFWIKERRKWFMIFMMLARLRCRPCLNLFVFRNQAISCPCNWDFLQYSLFSFLASVMLMWINYLIKVWKKLLSQTHSMRPFSLKTTRPLNEWGLKVVIRNSLLITIHQYIVDYLICFVLLAWRRRGSPALLCSSLALKELWSHYLLNAYNIFWWALIVIILRLWNKHLR